MAYSREAGRDAGVIEQVIYFALGCIVTALLALLFLPVLWSRALRLSRKRLQLQVPLSMQEILAERDHLRARHAVEQLRVEQELDRVRGGRDADKATIGRATVESVRLAEEVEAFRKLNEAQRHEIGLLTVAVAEHKVESSALRQDLAAAHDGVAVLRGEAEAAAREHARLAEEGEGHRTSAAALLARVADYEAAQDSIVVLEVELGSARRELEAERERQKSFYLGNSLRVEKDRAAERATTERIDRLEAENAALKRALEVSGGAAGDAGLRESIHALGLAVATMTREQRERGAAG